MDRPKLSVRAKGVAALMRDFGKNNDKPPFGPGGRSYMARAAESAVKYGYFTDGYIALWLTEKEIKELLPYRDKTTDRSFPITEVMPKEGQPLGPEMFFVREEPPDDKWKVPRCIFSVADPAGLVSDERALTAAFNSVYIATIWRRWPHAICRLTDPKVPRSKTGRIECALVFLDDDSSILAIVMPLA